MRTLLVSYVAALGLVVFLADSGRIADWTDLLHHLPWGDKAAHFLVAGALGMLAVATLLRRWRNRPLSAIGAATVAVMLVTTAEEFTNLLTPFRGWSLGDIGANCLGVACLGTAPALAWVAVSSLRREREVPDSPREAIGHVAEMHHSQETGAEAGEASLDEKAPNPRVSRPHRVAPVLTHR